MHENFNEWVPASANFVNYKEGIFYPYNDKLLMAFKEMEEVTIFFYLNRFMKKRRKYINSFIKMILMDFSIKIFDL